MDRIYKLTRWVLLGGAILFILVYVVLAVLRIRYPFELEWMEGGSVAQVARILSGQKLYVSPSLEFTPFMYTPLYFYLSAGVSKILGIGFTPLRVVSFVSSLCCFFIIFQIVRRETGSKFPAILASCLFAATFRIAGAWFDIARVDSLFLLFLLAGIYFVRFGTSARSYVLAGVFISLSFLTKEITLVICVPVMLYCVLTAPRRSIPFVATVITLIAGSTLLLDYIHDGWYKYYVFELALQHPLVQNAFIGFWVLDLLGPLLIACGMSVFYMLRELSNFRPTRSFFFYLSVATGMLGGAWYSRLHSGGYDNVLMPAYAAIAILFGLGIHRLFQYADEASGRRVKLIGIVVCLLAILQFLFLWYNPLRQIPSEKDQQAGQGLVDQIAQIQGDVLVPFHGYLATLAGKKSYVHEQAMSDVLRGNSGPIKDKLIAEISDAIRQQIFNAIILDRDDLSLLPDMDKYYVKQGQVLDRDDVFWPVTGTRTRPEYIYVPKRNAPS